MYFYGKLKIKTLNNNNNTGFRHYWNNNNVRKNVTKVKTLKILADDNYYS